MMKRVPPSKGWFRHKLQEMRNVLANAQGSVHIHCMFFSTVACSISYFTTGSSICTNLTQPLSTEDKQNLMEPHSVPNKLRHSFSFISLVVQETKGDQLTWAVWENWSPLACSAGWKPWRDHFARNLTMLSRERGLITRSWKAAMEFCSSSEPSPPTVALLCIQDYWLSSPNPMIECPGQKQKKKIVLYTDR